MASTVVGPVRVGAPAHGGSCVARMDDGRVLFVRHAIPGELVRVRIVDDTHASWWSGETTEVLEASPDRVAPPCPVAGRCGGCDLQHVALPRQRALKAEVVSGLLRRFAGLDVPVTVEAVPGDREGLAWRTRMRYLVADGTLGLRAWHSSAFVPVPAHGCPLACAASPGPAWLVHSAADAPEVAVAVDDDDQVAVWAAGVRLAGPESLTQRVDARTYHLRGDGFWQVHPGAAGALTRAVLQALAPVTGETAWDLYCGVGLF
ncbi:MAG: TRAM domain-containing protein, partial [Propionibacteriaceae bacterium]|nr:TRAM domain-containing protein [Propionibacteriaceae bacterium]